MFCYSTNKKTPRTAIMEAIRRGQAPDRGLFMPEYLPRFEADDIRGMRAMDYPELAFTILRPFFDTISEQELKDFCEQAYTFSPSLEPVENNLGIMRLDTGPTASFKDFAAVMMARLMRKAARGNEKLLVLTATSGDTGSAVAHAFSGVPGIDVLVLFPLDEVSDNQRKQITSISGNVRALAITGKFDDAQAMVKQAFADESLRDLNLTSANSINIARLLPQSVYYFWAYAQAVQEGTEVLFSIPSGNFGNMMGAVLAWKMGLPVKQLVIGTNANDAFPRFLQTGLYQKISPSRKCISNAMNVGHPSNLSRLVDLFGGMLDEKGDLLKKADIKQMRKLIYSCSVSDEMTRETIREAYQKHRLLLEPHGAVAWYSLTRYFEHFPQNRLLPAWCVETAHPAKFPEEIQRILKFKPEVPPSLRGLEERKEDYLTLAPSYPELKEFLLQKYRTGNINL